MTIDLLREEIGRSSNKHFMIDGFPRNKDNYDQWFDETHQRRLQESNIRLFGAMVCLCPEAVMYKRMLRRAGIEGRADDNDEVFKKRMHTFRSETSYVLDRFRERQLLSELDTSKEGEEYNRLIETVSRSILT